MSVTAEESGLLGSRYYAEHPVYPLARTVGGVNMDGLNVIGRAKDFVVTGAGKSELEDMMVPLVGPQGQVIANPRGNTIVVADYSDNVRRIRALIVQLDQDRSSTRAVTLRNSSAREIAAVLTSLTALPGADGKPGRGPVSVVAVDGSNTVLLRGEPDAIDRLLPLIADLDLRARSTDDVKVVFLKHANAEQLLPVLQQLMGLPASSAAASDSARLSRIALRWAASVLGLAKWVPVTTTARAVARKAASTSASSSAMSAQSKHERRQAVPVVDDPACVDAFAGQLLADETPHLFVADPGDQRRFQPQPGGADRDVGRAAADRLGERGDVLQPRAGLLPVKVHGRPADGDHIKRFMRIHTGHRPASTRVDLQPTSYEY
eukprot:gene39396-53262_t